jgi:hypothetical protein
VCFGLEGCLLVSRSSSTSVAVWTLPTWVVSRRHVLEAVFVLLEFPSPSRRIFIGSHSLPPSLVRRIGPSPEDSKGRKAASTPLSMVKEAKCVVKASPYHPQQVVPTLQGMSSRVLLNSEVMIWFTYFVVSCARGISG